MIILRSILSADHLVTLTSVDTWKTPYFDREFRTDKTLSQSISEIKTMFFKF